MDICSFLTAKKLKESGYPEPEFASLQVWYNEYCIGTFLGMKITEMGRTKFSCYSIGSGKVAVMAPAHGQGAIFAPTAADIMSEMKGIYLSPMQGGCWGVFKVGTNIMIGFHPENPAEACAEAYLSSIPNSR